MHVKKNDTVVVISGRDKGKRGTVLEVSRKHGKVKVQGVCIMVRHCKAQRRGEQPQIKRMESFIDASRVMYFDAALNSVVRSRPSQHAKAARKPRQSAEEKPSSQEVI